MNGRIGVLLGVVAGFLVLVALGLVTGVVSLNGSDGVIMIAMIAMTLTSITALSFDRSDRTCPLPKRVNRASDRR